MPLTKPATVPPDTIATVLLLLLQVPPLVALVSEILAPAHTAVGPVIAAGAGLTVIAVVVKQPVPNVYVIVAVPANIPLTMPVPDPTLATAVLLLAHVPPPTELLNVLVVPSHTFITPVMAGGGGFIVAVAVA